MSLLKKPEEYEINRAAILVVGESGCGKTSLCRHFPNAAFLSMEAGELCLKKYDYKPALRATINSTEDLSSVFGELVNGIDGIDTVFVDSLTEMGDMLLSELKEDPKYADPKQTLKMYGTYNEIMTKIIKSYRDMGKYTVIFTCLEERAKDGLESYEDFNIPGNSVKNMLKSYFDIVLHMKSYKDEAGNDKRVFLTSSSLSRLAKDRSGILNEVEDADLGVIINKVLNK